MASRLVAIVGVVLRVKRNVIDAAKLTQGKISAEILLVLASKRYGISIPFCCFYECDESSFVESTDNKAMLRVQHHQMNRVIGPPVSSLLDYWGGRPYLNALSRAIDCTQGQQRLRLPRKIRPQTP
jgi:hypothetical protein